jgi:hypothetical protein
LLEVDFWQYSPVPIERGESEKPHIAGVAPSHGAERCHNVIALLPYLTPCLSLALISCSPSFHEGWADRDDLTSTIIQPCSERLKLASFISWSLYKPAVVILSNLQDGVEKSRKRVQQSI